MGKIKSKLIKKNAKIFVDEGIKFTENFEKNKKILGSNTMPSKKLRNRMAGFLSRLKRQQSKKAAEMN